MKKTILIGLVSLFILISSAFALDVTEDDFAFYYAFDNDLTDSTGKGPTGELYDSTYESGTRVGDSGASISFTNGQSHVNWSHDENQYWINDANWTLNYWVKFETLSTTWTNFFNKGSGDSDSCWEWIAPSSGAGWPTADYEFKFNDRGSAFNTVTTFPASTNEFWMITLVSAGGTLYYYVNGTQVETGAYTPFTCSQTVQMRMGTGYNSGHEWIGDIDEFWAVRNRSLAGADLLEIYQNEMVYDDIVGVASNFTVTASTFYFGDTLNTFNATINGTQYTTTTGTIDSGILDDSGANVDITMYAVNHTDRLYSAFDVSSNLAGVLNYSYYKLNVSVTDWLSGDGIGDYNITVGATTWPGVDYTTLIDLAIDSTNNVYIYADDWETVNKTILLDEWQEALNFTTPPDHFKVNFTFSNTTGGTIQNFSITATSGYNNLEGETTTGTLILKMGKNITYNVTVDAPGFALTSQNIKANNWTQWENISIFTTNSVSITIRDETTEALILSNTSVTFTFNTTEYKYYTDTGSLYVDEIDPHEYDVLFNVIDSELDYGAKTYTITVGNRSHQTLNAYLSANAQDTIFTIKDGDTAELLEGVLSTMYRLINGTWTVIETKESDITGRVLFTYLPSVNYKFFLSFDNYDDYIFYLNPVLFGEYDILMTKQIESNETIDYESIAVIYSPKIFYDGTQNNFTFIIQSPTGELVDYGITLTYPGGTSTSSGSNALGGTLTNEFNITGATNFDTVELSYYYTSSIGGVRNFTYNYQIISDVGNNTMTANRSKTYGLGLFERILATTLIVLFVVGIASLIGQALPGFIIGLCIYGFLISIGFIEWWIVAITFLVGLIIIASKGGGN